MLKSQACPPFFCPLECALYPKRHEGFVPVSRECRSDIARHYPLSRYLCD